MDDFFYPIARPRTFAEWRALPDDVKAGIYEEIVEMMEQEQAERHWAWCFVQPFLDFE